jgi:hypothetical protein
VKYFRTFGLAAVLVVAVVGCARVPYAISNDDRARFGKNLIVAHLPGRTDPLIVGASGCKLYRARIEHQEIVGWDVTLAADWGAIAYPQFLTACSNESLSWDGKYVRVYFCALAIGAGGGCTNGGYYRSRTGARPWWISGDGVHGWAPLPQ